jgi:triphosphatase
MRRITCSRSSPTDTPTDRTEAAAVAIEIELKLTLAPQDIPRLQRHPLWRAARRIAAQKLYTVYYDTPELDLWRSGLTLRLRKAGARWVQTVKGGGGASGGLHRRYEFEAPVAGPLPDLTLIDGSEWAGHFAAPQVRTQLKPVMLTEFVRSRACIEDGTGMRIEASLDRGLIKSGDATEPVSELELEVAAGEPWRAYQVALKLAGRVPLLVENRSKAHRGLALHEHAAPAPVKATASPVAREMSAQDAFIALAGACLDQFVANQRGMIAGADPEYLHQMRVALRRLRSVFGTFAPLLPPAALVMPIAETRWLAGSLGAARDWDVFATETLPPITARYPEHDGVAAFAAAVVRLRRQANRSARQAVVSTRGQGFLLSAAGWLAARTWLEQMEDAHKEALDQPVADFARAVIGAAHTRVLRRGRGFGKLSAERLHRLRIAVKKLRYAIEFFGSLYDDVKLSRYRAVLVDMQDHLGRFNDARVAAALAARAGAGLEGSAGAEARGIMLGWNAGAQQFGMRELERVWKRFRACKPFWR